MKTRTATDVDTELAGRCTDWTAGIRETLDRAARQIAAADAYIGDAADLLAHWINDGGTVDADLCGEPLAELVEARIILANLNLGGDQ